MQRKAVVISSTVLVVTVLMLIILLAGSFQTTQARSPITASVMTWQYNGCIWWGGAYYCPTPSPTPLTPVYP
jgi:hypothetical protein